MADVEDKLKAALAECQRLSLEPDPDFQKIAELLADAPRPMSVEEAVAAQRKRRERESQ